MVAIVTRVSAVVVLLSDIWPRIHFWKSLMVGFSVFVVSSGISYMKVAMNDCAHSSAGERMGIHRRIHCTSRLQRMETRPSGFVGPWNGWVLFASTLPCVPSFTPVAIVGCGIRRFPRRILFRGNICL